jgi:crotonobetainyl-CoA:carnitine CoA-transferase CaiB-like acyl-CoA transferase
MDRALAGFRVLELCSMVAGPFCTKIMADMGAEVVKVESPGEGDVSRRRGPFPGDVPHPERSGLFLYLNTNKLGITLDATSSEGRDILKELVKQCDILVEDCPAGAMSDLGLGYEALSGVNPRLIMTSITAFGQTGPYRDYKAYPLNSIHSCGEGYVTPSGSSFPDRPPVKLGGFAGEYEVGIYAALGTLVALYRRNSIGRGQHLDISKQEALTVSCLFDHLPYTMAGMTPTRLMPRVPETGVVPCKDGHVMCVSLEQTFWLRIREQMRNPDWAKADWYEDQDRRREHAAEVRQRLEDWAGSHTKRELHEGALENGVALSPFLTPAEIMGSDLLKGRGFFEEIDHPHAGSLTYITAPYHFSKTPWRCERAAPMLGEHNEKVYCGMLGYTKREVDGLTELGII